MLKAVNIIHKFSDSIKIEDFTFSFSEGKIYGLLGIDEFQISVLSKILGGIEKPDQGSVLIEESDIYSSAIEDVRRTRSNLSYVFSSGGLLSNLTVKENLLLPLDFFYPSMSKDEKLKKINYWLNEFQLNEEIYDLRPALLPLRLSKLILFIRAYITSPKIIIYDEPFLNLNYKDRDKIKKRIEELNSQRNVIQIIKSNSDNDFMDNFDILIIFDEGKMIDCGSRKEVEEAGKSKSLQILEYYS